MCDTLQSWVKKSLTLQTLEIAGKDAAVLNPFLTQICFSVIKNEVFIKKNIFLLINMNNYIIYNNNFNLIICQVKSFGPILNKHPRILIM